MPYNLREVINNNISIKNGFFYSDQFLSFSELNKKADILAQTLREKGVNPCDLIGIEQKRSFDYLIAILATIKVGSCFLPIDPMLPKKVIEERIKQSLAKFLIRENVVETLSATSIPLNPDALYVIYTSGSSGIPKGVIGSKKALINRLLWMEKTFPFSEGDILCQKTSMNFVDHIAEIFQPIFSGISSVILSDEILQDSERLLENIEYHRVSRIVLVPSLLSVILSFPGKKLQKLKSLKFIFCSGEALSKSIASLCAEKLSWVRLINIYGSSEVSADVTYYEYNESIKQSIKAIFLRGEECQKEEKIPLEDLSKRSKDFLSVAIPEVGSHEETYLKFFHHLKREAVDISSNTFLGHMTTKIPSIFSELSKLIASLNQNLVKVETSNIFTLLEVQIVGIFHNLVYEYGQDYYNQKLYEEDCVLGLVLNGGTLGNIQALFFARQNALLKQGASLEEIKAFGFDQVLSQLGFQKPVILCSKLAHYSIEKAIHLFGMGKEQILHFDNEKDQIEELIEKCQRESWLIIAIVGIAGKTETGEIDDLLMLAELSQKRGIFYHVDAAWGGASLFSERLKEKFKGIHRADSVSICGHKQLYLPLGTSILLFKNPRYAARFKTNAAYQSRKGEKDLGQFSLLGSKPAVSVFLHAGISIFGKGGYRFLVEDSVQKAQFFAQLVKKQEAFELIKDPDLNIVNYRYIPSSLRGKEIYSEEESNQITVATRAIQQRQFQRNQTFVSYTEIPDQEKEIGIFRAVFLNPLSEYKDMSSVLNDQLKIAHEIFEKEPLLQVNEEKWREDHSSTVPIGYPIHNADIYLLDESLRDVPFGAVGEIFVGGDVLSLGYLHSETLTEELFISDPKTNKRIYKSGDLGKRLTNGAIEFLGRKDEQMKINGCRIEPLGIELLMKTIDGVDQAIIFALQKENILVSCYTSKKDISSDDVKKALEERLPKYMIPSLLFQKRNFPLLPSGKIDRVKLKESLFEEKQESEKKEESIKMQITEILIKHTPLISLPSDQNFFELGFTSLSLNKALIDLQEQLLESLKFTDLFNYSSIAKLSEYILDSKEKYFPSVAENNILSRREYVISSRRKLSTG